MRVLSLWLVIISTTLFFTLVKAYGDATVTPLGRIQGRTVFYNGIIVREYLGIPYAKPPVGNFRFKKPVPVEPWNTTLQAKQFSPGCIQYSPNPVPWKDTPPGLSEDCLYLNIWTPLTSAFVKSKSVMFWIHTGGFSTSSSRVDVYNGRVLAAEGDVVVVTINYRLGAEGFFYSGTEDAPGNMGLWDMAAALKWVRNNIESFGGDKNSITLFGHSAGGIAIGMLCVSPVTKGLFRRVIMQSGSPTNLDGEDPDRGIETSRKLAKAVGCATDEFTLDDHPEEITECMRKQDGFELAELLIKVKGDRQRVVYPRYGDEFLPKNPRQAVFDGDFVPVDVLIGNTDGEGSPLITASMKDVFGYFGQKDPQINLTFGASIIRDKFKHYPSIKDEVVERYLGGLKEDDYYKIRFEVCNSFGDFKRVCPSLYFAESFARKGAVVYYYFFTHRSRNSPFAPWMLAVHFQETPYVFGYPLRYPANYTVAEQILSRRLVRTWSSFAKTGHPTVGIWQQFSKERPIYTHLDVGTITTGIGLHKDDCDFFRPTFGL